MNASALCPTSVWLVSIERRVQCEGNIILGPHASHTGAIAAVRAYVERRYSERSIASMLAAYGGNLDEGSFYSEDETITTFERPLLP